MDGCCDKCWDCSRPDCLYEHLVNLTPKSVAPSADAPSLTGASAAPSPLRGGAPSVTAYYEGDELVLRVHLKGEQRASIFAERRAPYPRCRYCVHEPTCRGCDGGFPCEGWET